ncbi:DNA-binding transcriptional MerR regulator [Naumannella cuiyingiana]|uniref:DNA-binding transcriptional MerR regulator n=1 Tax=Naumannella cuiyingiana TaxID=1347891 RepID=A0A7Z0DAZ0_9ACTN|nr:DNA-binding transcriptional MerR regulator [Naumannella cuiyingiana]
MATVGEAAAGVGVPPHVLRHWESEGLVSPGRDAAGRRVFVRQDIDRVAVVARLRRIGLPIPVLRRLLADRCADKRAALAEQGDRWRRKRAELDAMIGYLDHLAACRHPVIAECPECSEYAAG